jgi:hypothetical protein
MRDRPIGARVAAAGLAVLVIVLVGTPDFWAWVLLAWVLIVGAVAAVAFGVAVGFRRQAGLAEPPAPAYLTADWLRGAQFLTLGDMPESTAVLGQPEELGDAVVASGEVPAVDGDGLAGHERRIC